MEGLPRACGVRGPGRGYGLPFTATQFRGYGGGASPDGFAPHPAHVAAEEGPMATSQALRVGPLVSGQGGACRVPGGRREGQEEEGGASKGERGSTSGKRHERSWPWLRSHGKAGTPSLICTTSVFVIVSGKSTSLREAVGSSGVVRPTSRTRLDTS